MGKVYYRTFYHIVWSTKLRRPFISQKVETHLREIIPRKAAALGATLIEIGMASDHCHVVVSIPPARSVSELVGKLKGSSSHYLNKEVRATRAFDWQDGFAVFSLSERDVPRVAAYVKNQHEHHRRGSTVQADELPEDAGSPRSDKSDRYGNSHQAP